MPSLARIWLTLVGWKISVDCGSRGRRVINQFRRSAFRQRAATVALFSGSWMISWLDLPDYLILVGIDDAGIGGCIVIVEAECLVQQRFRRETESSLCATPATQHSSVVPAFAEQPIGRRNRTAAPGSHKPVPADIMVRPRRRRSATNAQPVPAPTAVQPSRSAHPPRTVRSSNPCPPASQPSPSARHRHPLPALAMAPAGCPPTGRS